jgi:protein-tyrosine phosphatase
VGRVLFLCTGNYYRSRFAELLFNRLAEARNLPWRADSCGLEPHAANVGPISRHTVSGLAALGIPIGDDSRAPRKVAESDFLKADLIVAVKEAEHRSMLEQGFPAWLRRVEFWNIHDLDYAQPGETMAELQRHVACLIDRIAADEANGQEMADLKCR